MRVCVYICICVYVCMCMCVCVVHCACVYRCMCARVWCIAHVQVYKCAVGDMVGGKDRSGRENAKQTKNLLCRVLML